jgi:hypothetical protein
MRWGENFPEGFRALGPEPSRLTERIEDEDEDEVYG